MAKAEVLYDPDSKSISFAGPVFARYPEDYLTGSLILAAFIIGGLVVIFALLKLFGVLAVKFYQNGRLQKNLTQVSKIVARLILVMVVALLLGYVVMRIFEQQPRPENRTKRIWLFERWL